MFDSRYVHINRCSMLTLLLCLQKDKHLICSKLRLDITPSYDNGAKILRVYQKHLCICATSSSLIVFN